MNFEIVKKEINFKTQDIIYHARYENGSKILNVTFGENNIIALPQNTWVAKELEFIIRKVKDFLVKHIELVKED